MKPGATEILRQVDDLMDTAERIGLSSQEYRELMREIEREARRRIVRDARICHPSGRRCKL